MNNLNVETKNAFKVSEDFNLKLINNIENCGINVLHKVSELITSYNKSNNIEERNSIVSRIYALKTSIPQITSFMKIVDKNLGNLLDQVDLKDRTAEIKYYQNAQNEIGFFGSEINYLQTTKSPKIKDLLSKIDWTNSVYSLFGLILFKSKI